MFDHLKDKQVGLVQTPSLVWELFQHNPVFLLKASGRPLLQSTPYHHHNDCQNPHVCEWWWSSWFMTGSLLIISTTVTIHIIIITHVWTQTQFPMWVEHPLPNMGDAIGCWNTQIVIELSLTDPLQIIYDVEVVLLFLFCVCKLPIKRCNLKSYITLLHTICSQKPWSSFPFSLITNGAI